MFWKHVKMTQGIQLPHTNLCGQTWSNAFLLPCALFSVNCIPHEILAIAYGRKGEHSSNLSYDKKRLWKSHVHKSEDNIKGELGETSCERVDCVQMKQDVVLGSKQTGNFLTSWATFSFSTTNLLHRLLHSHHSQLHVFRWYTDLEDERYWRHCSSVVQLPLKFHLEVLIVLPSNYDLHR